MEFWLVLGAGFLAAVMNSLAGGGTMVTFPALLGAGLPPLLANTTSSVALFAGMPAGVWSYRRKLEGCGRWLLSLGLVSVIGGALGGYLLLALGDEVFEYLVPWLILGATALFLLQVPLQRWLKRRSETRERQAPEFTQFSESEQGACVGRDDEQRLAAWPPVWVMFLQLSVAVYGGYFGAGIGILMLAGLGLVGLGELARMNAIKVVLGALCNLASVVYFVVLERVDWSLALWLLAGSIPGYWLGGKLGQWVPAWVVRVLVVLIGIWVGLALLIA